MGRIRNDDLGTLCFTTLSKVFLYAPNGSEFTLSTSNWLKCYLVHTRTDFKHVLHFVIDGQQTLEVMFGLMWVDVGNTWQLGNHFVDTRIMLHGA